MKQGHSKTELQLQAPCTPDFPGLDGNCSTLWSDQVCSSGSGNSPPALKQSNVGDRGVPSGAG